VSTQQNTPGPDLLGNSPTAPGPPNKEGQTRRRRDIVVRVSFETHRLAPTYVATAYEHLVPLRHRDRRAATGAAPARADAGRAERAGA
jgi:hypothetical protein